MEKGFTKSIADPVFRRPPQSLQEFPIEIRWEVTRRHPVYLTFWKTAANYLGGNAKTAGDELYGRCAVGALQLIGVSGKPPPPSAGATSIGTGQLASEWIGGAVAPMTLRAYTGLLVRYLPPEVRRSIGRLMQEHPKDDEDEDALRYRLILEVMSDKTEALNAVPDRPIVGLNIYAPQRAITEAIDTLIRDLKKKEKIDQRRRRDEHYADYLKTWDLREGWCGDHYEIGREKSFRDIAKQLRISIRTAANHYYAAFQMICGYSYTYANWITLFAAQKLMQLDAVKSLQRRRDRRVGGGAPKLIADSAFGTDDMAGGVISDNAVDKGVSFDEIVWDVAELIAKGRTDDQIVAAMDWKSSGDVLELISYLRARHADSQGGSERR